MSERVSARLHGSTTVGVCAAPDILHFGMYVRAPVVVAVQRRRHGVGSSALEAAHVRMHVPHGSLLASNAAMAAEKPAASASPISSIIVHTPVDNEVSVCARTHRRECVRACAGTVGGNRPRCAACTGGTERYGGISKGGLVLFGSRGRKAMSLPASVVPLPLPLPLPLPESAVPLPLPTFYVHLGIKYSRSRCCGRIRSRFHYMPMQSHCRCCWG